LIRFKSSTSLALELHTICDGSVDTSYEYLSGGWSFLIGDANVFWSLMIHKKFSGKFLPPSPPGSKWDESYCVNELVRMLEAAETTASGGIKVAGSQSMSAISFIRLRHDGAHPLKTNFDPVPSFEESLPEWWTTLETFYQGMWDRAVCSERGLQPTAPCMFFCADKCKAAQNCKYFHDDVMKEQELTRVKKYFQDCIKKP
jgi:hypothetical protein